MESNDRPEIPGRGETSDIPGLPSGAISKSLISQVIIPQVMLLFFLPYFIFRGHSTPEPASSRLTYFILRAYTGTSVSQRQQRKKLEEDLEKMQVNGPEG